MRAVYRVLAFIIAVEVALQASFIVWGDAGLGLWIEEEGGVVDKATFETAFESGEAPFPEFLGFMLHGMNGMMVIPALALITFIVSFFAKVPGGIRNAAAVLALVVLQVMLGLFGHENAYIGMLHGVNALILFSAAVYTGREAAKASAAEVGFQQEPAATV